MSRVSQPPVVEIHRNQRVSLIQTLVSSVQTTLNIVGIMVALCQHENENHQRPNREKLMKILIPPMKTLLISALIVFAVGCSEFNAPTASVTTDEAISYQYPPLDEALAAAEAAGYTVIDFARPTLDDNECDTVSSSRNAVIGQTVNINVAGICKLTIPGSSLPYDMVVTVVAPASCAGVCDFYPHPTQFAGNVEIRWDTRDFVLPEGIEFDEIVPLYVHDDGTIEEVSFVRSENRFITVTTNHFSRYIITSRVGS